MHYLVSGCFVIAILIGGCVFLGFLVGVLLIGAVIKCEFLLFISTLPQVHSQTNTMYTHVINIIIPIFCIDKCHICCRLYVNMMFSRPK